VSNDSLLFKTFKFFDLNNVGYVPRNEFFRAIAKTGVVISSPEVHLANIQDMNTVFEYYDKQK
jgi:Ca2+-binding EF-hand superfamily protein